MIYFSFSLPVFPYKEKFCKKVFFHKFSVILFVWCSIKVPSSCLNYTVSKNVKKCKVYLLFRKEKRLKAVYLEIVNVSMKLRMYNVSHAFGNFVFQPKVYRYSRRISRNVYSIASRQLFFLKTRLESSCLLARDSIRITNRMKKKKGTWEIKRMTVLNKGRDKFASLKFILLNPLSF